MDPGTVRNTIGARGAVGATLGDRDELVPGKSPINVVGGGHDVLEELRLGKLVTRFGGEDRPPVVGEHLGGMRNRSRRSTVAVEDREG